MELQNEIKTFLRQPPIDLNKFLRAIFLLRFKDAAFHSTYINYIDDFLQSVANLLSCIPSERKECSEISIFKLQS